MWPPGPCRQIRQAEEWALEALSIGARSGTDVERLALDALTWTRSLSGQPIDELVERYRTASDEAFFIAESPERVAGQRLVWRGEVERARVTLSEFLAIADDQAELVSYALARLHLCELELRVGEWTAAARLLDEWAESPDRELLVPPMYERCRALLAAGRGIPGEARRWAEQAISGARATGFRWDELEALRAEGIAALLEHDPAGAVQSLRLCGTTPRGRASTSRGCSRSHPTSSRR